MRVLLPLLFLVPFPLPQDKPKRAWEWKTDPGSVLEYDVLDPKSNKASGQIFFVFASELRQGGGNRIAVDRYADLGWPLLFRLPREGVKPGQIWDHTAFFFHEAAEATAAWGWGGASSIRPVQARGRYALRKIEKDDIAWIDGEFELFEIRRDQVNNQLKLTVTKNKVGTVSTSAAFRLSRGLLEQGSYSVDAPRAQERVRDREDWKVTDKRVRETRRIQFKESLKLDPEKMAKAVEASLKRAVSWLRKRQKPSGEFVPERTFETDRIDANYTGAVVRAWIGAGVSAEDEAVLRAVRSLRSNPGPRTPQTYSNLTGALLARFGEAKPSLSKEDAAQFKAALEVAADLWDRKTGGWFAGARKSADVPNVGSSRHACEILYHASLAGPPPSADLVRPLAETLPSLAMDESELEDLDLGFVEGFQAIDVSGKGVVPASWRSGMEKQAAADPMGSRDSKGHALTTLAALESLLLLRASIALSESQKKPVEAAIRKGLAWMQRTWTLRTPPPTEAGWSLRRSEYLAALGRVLAGLGIRTVSGSDWYWEGAYLLLREQYEDGSWDSSGSSLLDTLHAVLFLTRVAPRLPAAK